MLTEIEVQLSSIATIIMGTSPRGDTYNEDGEGLPLLNGPTEFGDFHPNCTQYTIDSKRQCESGDLIFCVRGSTTGRMNWADKTYSLGRGVCAIRGDTKSDSRFIRFCLVWKLDSLLKRAGGATFPNLRKEDIETFQLPFPPTRPKIVAILSAYDDLIENNTRRIKILEEMAQTIYREWFVEFRAPGVELRKATPEEQKLIGKDVFPKGWEVTMLGEMAEEKRRGISPSDIDDNTPYFGLEHLPRKSIALSQWGRAADVKSTKLAFKKREILFGKIRPYFHKVGVAPLDGVCSSDAIVIVPKQMEFFATVLSCVSSEAFVNHASQTSQGTKMPRANWDVLIKYPVVKPDKATMESFNQIISDVVDLIINNVFRNRNLQKTRDLLLPKLISGEVSPDYLEKIT